MAITIPQYFRKLMSGSQQPPPPKAPSFAQTFANAMNAAQTNSSLIATQNSVQQQGLLGQLAAANNWTPNWNAGPSLTPLALPSNVVGYGYLTTDSNDQTAPESRRVYWACREYSLGQDCPGSREEGYGYFILSRVGRNEGESQRCDLVHWAVCPSRSMLAAALRWDRAQRLDRNARDEFGSLLGVRWFKLTDNYRLQSPHQLTVWPSAVYTTPTWDDSGAYRGTHGVHAAWPSLGRSVVQPYIDSNGHVVAKVRGQGKFVAGKLGWRAERVIVDTVYLPAPLMRRSVVRQLEKQYPTISFEEESWTLERSSKRAR